MYKLRRPLRCSLSVCWLSLVLNGTRAGRDACWQMLGFRARRADSQADSAEGQERKVLEGTLGAYWYLDYLCVDTSLQSKGLGTRALAHCIRQAQV